MKTDYSLPFVFHLSALVFILYITPMPQQLVFFKTPFEGGPCCEPCGKPDYSNWLCLVPVFSDDVQKLQQIPEAWHPSEKGFNSRYCQSLKYPDSILLESEMQHQLVAKTVGDLDFK